MTSRRCAVRLLCACTPTHTCFIWPPEHNVSGCRAPGNLIRAACTICRRRRSPSAYLRWSQSSRRPTPHLPHSRFLSPPLMNPLATSLRQYADFVVARRDHHSLAYVRRCCPSWITFLSRRRPSGFPHVCSYVCPLHTYVHLSSLFSVILAPVRVTRGCLRSLLEGTNFLVVLGHIQSGGDGAAGLPLCFTTITLGDFSRSRHTLRE